VKDTKTRQRRTVTLLAPLAADLAEWRMRCGRPGPDALVFPARDGAPWTEDRWRNWRKRIFQPAARALGLERARPYDLRHSFVSLLIAEGKTVVEVARRAGHAPTMSLDTYAHVFGELAGERQSAEALIRAAREAAVSPGIGSRVTPGRNVPGCRDFVKPSSGLEPETPSLPWRSERVTHGHGRSFASTFVLQIWPLVVCRQCPRVAGRARADVPVSYPRSLSLSTTDAPMRAKADRRQIP